jgi:hypothetical protein
MRPSWYTRGGARLGRFGIVIACLGPGCRCVLLLGTGGIGDTEVAALGLCDWDSGVATGREMKIEFKNERLERKRGSASPNLSLPILRKPVVSPNSRGWGPGQKQGKVNERPSSCSVLFLIPSRHKSPEIPRRGCGTTLRCNPHLVACVSIVSMCASARQTFHFPASQSCGNRRNPPAKGPPESARARLSVACGRAILDDSGGCAAHRRPPPGQSCPIETLQRSGRPDATAHLH